MPAQVADRVGLLGECSARADLLDPAVTDVQAAVGDLPPLGVHRDQERGIPDQAGGHGAMYGQCSIGPRNGQLSDNMTGG